MSIKPVVGWDEFLEKITINYNLYGASNFKFAIFMGAGLSKLVGLPLWSELATSAIEKLYNNGEDKLSFSEKEWLHKNIPDVKHKISLFHANADSSVIQKFYSDKLFLNRNDNIKKTSRNPYQIISNIDKLFDENILKITINVDKEFEKVCPSLDVINNEFLKKYEDSIVTNIKNNEEMRINKNHLYKIHGSADVLASTVMTMEKYIEIYYKNKSPQVEFLNKIFSDNYTIVFIGTGLTELEILSNIIPAKNRKNCYALYANYAHHKEAMTMLSKTFNGIGLEIIPYDISKRGYESLIDILFSWEQKISDILNKNMLIDKVKEIDEAIDYV